MSSPQVHELIRGAARDFGSVRARDCVHATHSRDRRSNFINQALSEEPLTIYGDGSQTRSLCYESDLGQGLVAMMACDANPGPVNLGNPIEMSVREIADVILDLIGSASPLQYAGPPHERTSQDRTNDADREHQVAASSRV